MEYGRALRQIYRDAYAVGWVGASNPVAVARTVSEIADRLSDIGFDHADLKQHPAFRVVVGQLAYLLGMSLGPDVSDLNAVRATVEAWDARPWDGGTASEGKGL